MTTGITFDQTVPRALVDRGDTTTVLITSWTRTATTVTAGAVWPRLGGYYSLLDPARHDPLLVLETLRQGSLLLAHVLDDVPLATMQIMRSVHYTAEPDGLTITDEPTELVVTVECDHEEPDGHTIMQTQVSCRMYRDGRLVGSGGGQAVVPPADRYLKVRGRDPLEVVVADVVPGPAVAARTVGRALERDVVLSPGDVVLSPGEEAPDGTAYRLRIDPGHANFFDNPTDHTPGMLLTEAMRQAVVAESGDPYFTPMSMSARFLRFVELDHPADVLVRRVPAGFRTEVHQFGRRAAHAKWPLPGGGNG
ncbi:ScbA/BarX family gamma-butyrolactone biosynthesis protein [Polymorphospora sp. NPDC050346]|uniref:ScbA/BarX family gamma-butyrolactone biosynthesis protein n=1 Tax=Polymorphospora sp. NPDC050346 TaxID=3155780 RepID=UPI0033E1C582